MYRSQKEFLLEAFQLKRPIDMPGAIPDELLHCHFDMLSLPTTKTAKFRIKAVMALLKLFEHRKAADKLEIDGLESMSRTAFERKRFHTALILIDDWVDPNKELDKGTSCWIRPYWIGALFRSLRSFD